LTLAFSHSVLAMRRRYFDATSQITELSWAS